MPCLDKQFGVLSICDWAPACFKNLLYLVRPEKDIRGVAGDTIYSCAQRAKRTECVCDVAGGSVDGNCLRLGSSCCH